MPMKAVLKNGRLLIQWQQKLKTLNQQCIIPALGLITTNQQLKMFPHRKSVAKREATGLRITRQALEPITMMLWVRVQGLNMGLARRCSVLPLRIPRMAHKASVRLLWVLGLELIINLVFSVQTKRGPQCLVATLIFPKSKCSAIPDQEPMIQKKHWGKAR